MAEITPEKFKELTGQAPERDDLQRVNCDLAGESGHWQCGLCEEHDKPRFLCGCVLVLG